MTAITNVGRTPSTTIPVVFYDIPAGAMVRIFPVSAGTATVYSSGSTRDSIALDAAVGNSAILANTNARWSQWAAGPVTADTVQTALMPQTAVALLVTSGTWAIEVCQ